MYIYIYTYIYTPDAGMHKTILTKQETRSFCLEVSIQYSTIAHLIPIAHSPFPVHFHPSSFPIHFSVHTDKWGQHVIHPLGLLPLPLQLSSGKGKQNTTTLHIPLHFSFRDR